MQPQSKDHSGLRVLSMVQATTVTGPLKPLLLFSASVRAGFEEYGPVRHTLLTTRRTPLLVRPCTDRLRAAAEAVDMPFVAVPERFPFDPAVLRPVREAIDRICPHIVESHDYKSHFLLFTLMSRHPKLLRPKWIAFHHGYTRTSWKVSVYQQLDRLTLRNADRIVTLCKPFAETLVGRGVRSEMIEIISNCIGSRPLLPSDATERFRADLGIRTDECVIVTVGRLSREKSHADLLIALQQMLTERPERRIRLLIVGDGPERGRLSRLAVPLGPSVAFLGHLDNPWPALSIADIFVLPSRSEGSPLAILEAMSAGLAIIATRVGAIPEMLTHDRTALLVPPGVPEALSASLTRLADDAALRLRLGASAQLLSANYSAPAYARTLLQIYGKTMRQADLS